MSLNLTISKLGVIKVLMIKCTKTKLITILWFTESVIQEFHSYMRSFKTDFDLIHTCILIFLGILTDLCK